MSNSAPQPVPAQAAGQVPLETGEHVPGSDAEPRVTGTETARPARGAGGVLRASLQRFSGLYALALVILLFSLLSPSLFFSKATFTLILSNQAVTGFLALGALLPLVAGCIDLAFASIAGFSAVFTTWMSIHSGWNDIWIVVAGVAISACFGMLSGLVVARFNLNSLVVTLAVSSLALGLTELIANGNALTVQFGPTLTSIGQGGMGPIPTMAILMVALAIIVYVWLEHTASGRFTLAAGSNPVAARLAGIRVARLQFLSLTISAAVAGFAGVLIAASVGQISETTASGYLLPAVATVFLGTTQVRRRPNVGGTIIALYLLGTGIKGLQLEGASNWVNDFFNGAVLLGAVMLATLRKTGSTPSTWRAQSRRLLRRGTS